ncbi:exodeoxyribonuclease VII large subunit [Methylophilus sp. 14]|uniref:exodeoxyribonuclease VII large subunit n=1 Tax=Methylophilus sp. 14 TaxID=2781019 RepID=UPI001890A1E7|nr:exodeoxyribonuclease VII large subunit [Methylophilus sp. 14]MBF4988140.1 hypothetical protein [Methylophilus sp. 14]
MIYTINTLNQLFKSITEQAINLTKDHHGHLIQVEGEIGDVTVKNYATLFGVKLSQGTDYVSLDIPKTLIEGNSIYTKQYVKVTGTIKPDISSYTHNKLQFKIDVTAIQATESPVQSEKHRENQERVQKLLNLNPGSRSFPLKERLSITYITGIHSKVEDDFNNALLPINDFIQVKPVYVSMLDKDAITKTITEAKGDILAIIRGGGSASEFQVFNEPEVMTALAEFKGYRTVGLGHASDATYCDLIADFSGDTPTQLAVDIREKYEQYLKLLKDRMQQNQQIQNLNQQVYGFKAEIERMKKETPILAPTREIPIQKNTNSKAGMVINAVLVIVVIYLAYTYIFNHHAINQLIQ